MIYLRGFILILCLCAASYADDGYFNQFVYHSVNQETDPDFPPRYIYYFVADDFPFEVPMGKDADLIVMLGLFLQQDGTFQIFYNDGIRPHGSETWPPRFCLNISGTWSVPENSLILKDANGKIILQADRAVIDGRNAMRATFTQDFQVAELKGLEHGLVSSQSQSPQSAFRCF